MGNGRLYIFYFLNISSNRWPLWKSVVSANQRKLWFLKKCISSPKFKPKFFTCHSITAKTESTFKQQKKFKLLALTVTCNWIFSKLSCFWGYAGYDSRLNVYIPFWICSMFIICKDTYNLFTQMKLWNTYSNNKLFSSYFTSKCLIASYFY